MQWRKRCAYIPIKLTLPCDISRLLGCAANYAGDGPTRRYGILQLNGIHIVKIPPRFYVDQIYQDVFSNRFPQSAIKVGDEVIKINQFYCEHLGNVSKYIEKTLVTSIQLRSKATGELFTESSSSIDATNQFESPSSSLQLTTTRRSRKRQQVEINTSNETSIMDLSMPDHDIRNNERSYTVESNTTEHDSAANNTINLIPTPQKKIRKMI